MLLVSYLFIVLLLAALTVRAVLRGPSLAQQSTGALVLVILLLRLFLVK